MRRRNVKVGQRVENKLTGYTGEIVSVSEELLFSAGVKWDAAPKPIMFYRPQSLRRLPGKSKERKRR